MLLHAHVFANRLYKDCSAGGISARVDEVVIVNRAEGHGSNDAVSVERSRLAGRALPVLLVHGYSEGICHAVPAELSEAGKWVPVRWPFRPMMGGAYIATSDGRFSEMVEAITGTRFYGAIPLHDRFES